MTDTTIFPGSPAATEPGIDMVPPGTGSDESESSDGRRRLILIGAVLGVLIIAGAAYMLLHKGSSSDNGPFVPHSAHAAPPSSAGGTASGAAQGTGSTTKGGSTTKAASSNKGAPATLPKKAKAPQVRDPFKPLALAPVAGSDGGATSTTTVAAPTTTTDGSTGTTTGTGTGSTGTTTGTDTGTGTTTPTVTKTPLWIQLMHVHGRMATFDVGYAHHKFRRFHVQAPLAGVHQATVFDKVFALVGISGGQVSLQIGDDTPFQLATGIAHSVAG